MISVVVPTCRRPEGLASCLAALSVQSVDRDAFEVLVVDNAVPATAGAIVRDFTPRLGVRLLHEPRPGPAAARNAGLQAARGAHVAFTDDDCRPDAGWLAGLVETAHAHPQALIGGPTLDARPDRLCSAASHLLVERFTAAANASAEGPAFFASSNLAAPRRAMLDLGGFDTRFDRAAGEDRDLCDRWRAAGLPLVEAPAALVRHAPTATLRAFLGRQVRYGRGAFLFHEARAARRAGPRFERPGFYADLIAAPYRVAPPPRATALAALMVLSQLAVAAGYASEAAGLKGLRSGG